MQNPDDAEIRDILTETRLIALVGASANPARPSHRVMRFLQSKGYRVIPVNPGLAGQDLLGEAVRASAADVPQDVDMVDIFRTSDAVPGVVSEALARWPGLRTVWTQLGVISQQGADMARARGVAVVQDRCPAIEYPRLIS